MSASFPDQRSCLEAIGRLLVDNVPDDWLWIRTEVLLNRIGAIIESVYQPPDADSEPEPFVIEDAATDLNLMNCFQDLATLLETKEAGRFRKCRFFIQNDGKYRAEYEY